MLRDVGLRGTHSLDNLLHIDLLVTQHAKNLQPQRMRNSLHGTRRLLDLLAATD